MTTQLITPRGPLKERLNRRLKKFEDEHRAISLRAAATAQKTSRAKFRYIRPSDAAPRAGRMKSSGKMKTRLRWKGTPGLVAFDSAGMDRQTPHWIIHEIGTGERATMKRGGVKNPRGRARKGSQYVRTVKSQRGRLISRGLAFGTGPSGQYSPPGSARGQGLYRMNDLTGWSPSKKRRALVIKREIEGQHFVQDGAKAGFREYRSSMRAAARRAFAGQKYR